MTNKKSLRIFFVGGHARSGTTWLQLLLDSHPEIACRGEAHLFSSFYDKLVRAFDAHNDYLKTVGVAPGAADFEPADFNTTFLTAVRSLLERWAEEQGVTCVGEKTPANLAWLTRLDRLLPDAKVVHIIRDGRDCAVSGWHANLRYDEAQFLQQFPDIASYVAHIAKRWSSHMREVRHFAHTKVGERYHELRYEDLVDAPEQTLAGVFRFLAVDRSQGVVSACLEAANFETLSEGRQRGQEDSGSFYRKGVVGDWRNQLSASDIENFERVAGPVLRELGYLP